MKNNLFYFYATVISLLAVIVLRVFVLQPYIVDSNSMAPVLAASDQVLVLSLFPASMIRRGRIAVINNVPPLGGEGFLHSETTHGRRLVKRIEALENQTLEISSGFLKINGTDISEKAWIKNNADFSKKTVPPGCVFVMGDNRVNSFDSRRFGAVSNERIEALALLIYWPPKKWAWIF